MKVKTFKADIIVFIGNVIMCLTSLLTNNSESKSVQWYWQYHLVSKLPIKMSIYVDRLRNSVSQETSHLIWDRNNIRFSIFVEYFCFHKISNFVWMKYMYITDYFSCYKFLRFDKGKKKIFWACIFTIMIELSFILIFWCF